MTREQYAALRRKIGGTGKDFFKDWVEEERVENSECSLRTVQLCAGGLVPVQGKGKGSCACSNEKQVRWPLFV